MPLQDLPAMERKSEWLCYGEQGCEKKTSYLSAYPRGLENVFQHFFSKRYSSRTAALKLIPWLVARKKTIMSILNLTWGLYKHKSHNYDTNNGMCCLLWRSSQTDALRNQVTVPLLCCTILPAFLASIYLSNRTFSFIPSLVVVWLKPI